MEATTALDDPANGGQKRSLDNPTDESITKREKVTGSSTEDGGAAKAEAAAASAEDPKGGGKRGREHRRRWWRWRC